MDVRLRDDLKAARKGDVAARARVLARRIKMAGLVVIGPPAHRREQITLHCPACGHLRRALTATILLGALRHRCEGATA